MEAAMQGDALVSGVTTVVTATTDPFFGMVAGVILRSFGF
jgi:hypothetical protein